MPPHPDAETSANGTFEGHRVDVFISYSRKDIAFARRLQRALSSYTPPSELPLPARRLRVFRDESDFQGTEYGTALGEALRSAAKLLVICSPNSRASSYVGDEIVRFAALRGKSHILTVLLAGVPDNEASATAEQKAFHEELLRLLPVPLAPDYRGWSEKRDSVDRDRFESAWYKLLADIYAGFGVDRSAIEQREKLRIRRTRRIRAALVTALTVVLASLTVWALMSRREALAQRNVAQSRFLAAQSMSGTHAHDLALLLAVASYRTAPSFEAWEALFSGLQRQPAIERFLHGLSAPARHIFARRTGTCASASTESDTTILWDLSTGQRSAELGGRALPFGSCRSVVTTSAGGEVAALSLEPPRQPRWTVRVPAPVSAWVIDSQDTMLALALEDGGLQLRDLADGRLRMEVTTPGVTFRSLRFSSDGERLGGIDHTGMVHRWNGGALSPASPPVRCGSGTGEVYAISRDLRWCAAGGPGRLILTDLTRTIGNVLDLGTPWILALDFGAGDRTLMAGVQGGALQFWNLEDSSKGTTRARPTVRSEHHADITAAAYTEDGGAIVSAARDGPVILWRAENRDRLMSEVTRATGSVTAVDGDTRRIATGTNSGLLFLSSPGTNQPAAAPLMNLGKPVTALTLRTGGEILAGTADGQIVALTDRMQRRDFSTGHAFPIVRIRVNDDGTRAAGAAENGLITLWDLTTGGELASFPGGQPRKTRGGGMVAGVDVAFEPAGVRLVSVHGDRQAFLWGWNGGSPQFTPLPFQPTSYFTSAAFAANGTIALGTGIYEGEVVLLDGNHPGAPVSRLRGHDLQDVTGLAFTPDGRMLFSGGFDGKVVLWDVAGRRRIADLAPARGSISALFLSRTASSLTAITDEGAVLRWDLDPGHWMELACRVANRELSPGEHARFGGSIAAGEVMCR